MLDYFFFYSLWSLEVGLLHPYGLSPQLWFVNMLLMGGGGWFSGHGDLRRAEHGNHTTLSVTKLAHPRSLGGNSDDPITQCLCMTCPPTTLDLEAN